MVAIAAAIRLVLCVWWLKFFDDLFKIFLNLENFSSIKEGNDNRGFFTTKREYKDTDN